MEPRFESFDVELHRVGHRLVDARDAKRFRAGAGRIRGKRHHVADGEMGFRGELTRHQNAGRRPGRLRPRANGAHGKTLAFAIADISTVSNFTIAVISALIGYVVVEYLRKKL